MTQGYAYDHAWAMERVRLAGLEMALDPGTREHLTRLGAGPGKRCLEVAPPAADRWPSGSQSASPRPGRWRHGAGGRDVTGLAMRAVRCLARRWGSRRRGWRRRDGAGFGTMCA